MGEEIRFRCPVAARCGGCQMEKMSYAQQLAAKQDWVRDLLRPYCRVDRILGMENPFHYRNKTHAVIASDKRGNVISGVYRMGTHQVVPVDDCLIENEKADEIIRTIRSMLASFKIRPYREDTRSGLIRHVLVRTGHISGQIMVVLVAAQPILPRKNDFVAELLRRHPEITTVVLNVNDRATSMVLGKRDIVLYGEGYIEDTLCGKIFRISPQSFYQVNSVQTEVLYNKALEYAGLTGREVLFDAYCGIGTIGITASDRCAKVIGVELNPEAVKDAARNAQRNRTGNVRVHCDDAGRFLTRMAAENRRCDVLMMDPPRSGSDEKFLRAVCTMAPPCVVYISCNPVTLARDLAFLIRHGYRALRATPVDMFPATEHVETICLLSKLNAKQHIEINLDMDELDLTDAEKKATYQEIKDYVLEHSGLKVSSLYIAQVKQKCGIIERENYNKPKSEDAKQPQCPPDKEKAIKEALTHFGMI